MSRFGYEDKDHYGGSINSSFFILKDHKDAALVRFMYNNLDDIQGYLVHQIDIEEKKRYVKCLRTFSQPVDNCPLCAEKSAVLPKLFLYLYDVETQEVKIWERGKSFYDKLSSLCARYNPLVSTLFEIERNGRKGDQQTRYETYPGGTDSITLDDLPELPELLGTIILDKSYEELEFFVNNNEFPNDENATVVRRGKNVESEDTNKSKRRTTISARSNKNKEDRPF